MDKILHMRAVDFERRFSALVKHAPDSNQAVRNTVRAIVDDVKNHGDDALLEYTKKFDDISLTPETMRIDPKRMRAAYEIIDDELREALTLSAQRIAAFHQAQMPDNNEFEDRLGVRLGNHWVPIESAGLYVPGGLASYPSSVLMNAIPARVAGVSRLAMVVPTPKRELNPAVLAAASIAGVDEIYTVGGAQAIAALAYGTATIPPVDIIVGPGNAYVAAAKQLVFGQVGIDMIAGPTDVVIVADTNVNPEWVAADLLAQAEHGPDSRALLITDSEAYAQRCLQAVDTQLATLPRKEIAAQSWEKHGMALVVINLLDEAPLLINRIAPEHLEIMTLNAREILTRVRNAGAVFLGAHTPEAMGDYIIGPSHVLPTGGTARFSSGLSVFTFLKRVSIMECDELSFMQLARQTEVFADSEALSAHARSVRIRG